MLWRAFASRLIYTSANVSRQRRSRERLSSYVSRSRRNTGFSHFAGENSEDWKSFPVFLPACLIILMKSSFCLAPPDVLSPILSPLQWIKVLEIIFQNKTFFLLYHSLLNRSIDSKIELNHRQVLFSVCGHYTILPLAIPCRTFPYNLLRKPRRKQIQGMSSFDFDY